MSTLLFDTDVFILLAGAGLVEETVSAVGSSVPDARRLQPLPFMLEGKRLRNRYPEGIRERAAAWCETIPALESAPDVRLLERLNAIPRIDVGEALLFASAAMADGSLVLTGDKHACHALARADLGRAYERLRGKVLCFETILRVLLDDLGFERVAGSFSPLRDVNQTLRLLLSQGERTPEQSFRDGLRSFEDDVVKALGALSWKPVS